MEEEEVIRRRLVAILDQCFSIAYPNFKTTTLFSVLHHCYLVKGRIHMYCKYMRGGFLSFHPLYHPHDFSHKIIKNGRIMWCATLPSMQWVIALYEAIYHQWVNNYFEETVGVVNEPRQLKTYSYYRSQDCDVSTVLLMVMTEVVFDESLLIHTPSQCNSQSVLFSCSLPPARSDLISPAGVSSRPAWAF